MRFVLAGSVTTTKGAFEALLRHKAQVTGVFGLAPEHAAKVSGYVDLRPLAESAAVPYMGFKNINDAPVVDAIRQCSPDYLLVIGHSQLVGREILSIPRKGSIGFHPTWLPRARGRAPIAWLILEQMPGAGTLFFMDEGADSGAILEQVPFPVDPRDYAEDVVRKAEEALDAALDSLIPKLIAGTAVPAAQDDSLATYYGKRNLEDGLIDWNAGADSIARLIRAASRPHPGAFTFHKGQKLIVWRGSIHPFPIKGVPGRVVLVTEKGEPVVQAGDGLIKLEEIESESGSPASLKVGASLGLQAQSELFELRQRVARLEAHLKMSG